MGHLPKDHIVCGCGAELSTHNTQLVVRFDELHGTVDHQNKVLEIQMSTKTSPTSPEAMI